MLQKKERKDDDAERAMFKAFHVLEHFSDFDGVPKETLREY